MTIIFPGSYLSQYLGGFSSRTDVQPFTYRDGATYLEIQERMRDYIENTLVPYVTENFAEINVASIIGAMIQAVAEHDAPITDAQMVSAFNTSGSGMSQLLDGRYVGKGYTGYVIQAPAPTGGDDTAMLQPLVDQAAAGGKLILQAGEYKANLITPYLYQQPWIEGQGHFQTKLRAVDASKPALLFNGHEGVPSGGGFDKLGLYPAVDGQGIGVEYRNTCGLRGQDVQVQGFQEGVRFHNYGTGGFTEFNTFEGAIVSCQIPVHYVVTGGDPSFHGTGVVGNTLVTGTWGGPGVVIDPDAFPYNAPLSATFFTPNPGMSIVSNRNGGRIANFYGTIRKEGAGATFGENSQYMISLSGSVMSMGGAGGDALGKLYLTDKFYLNPSNGNINLQYKPWQKEFHSTAGKAQAFQNMGTSLVNIDVVAPNYHYSYLLHCWQSPYNDGGVITELANPESLNGTGWGRPTFTWENRGLNITMGAGAVVTSYLSVTPQNAFITDDRQSQGQ